MYVVGGRRLSERGFADRLLIGFVCAAAVVGGATLPAAAPLTGDAAVPPQVEAVAPDAPLPLPEPVVPAPAEPAVEFAVPGPSFDVEMSHVYQTWNNCGPASVVMALSSMGVRVSQETARLALRGEDIRRGMPATNVDPWVRENFGLRALVRTGGSPEMLKRFVANGYPVLVTQWLEDPIGAISRQRIAHYRVVRGYDDARGVFVANDPYRGAKVALDYAWFDRTWLPFLYRYLVIFQPGDEARVRAIVGEDWDELRAREHTYARAKAAAEASRDQYAWAAYGEAAYRVGLFEESVAAFVRALAIGMPDGLFTVRSSYPVALRLLGREEEARAVQARIARLTTVPAAVELPLADPVALLLAARRGERLPTLEIAP